MVEGTPTICKNAREDDKKPDIISSIDGLSKYLGCGKTTAMKIMKQKERNSLMMGLRIKLAENGSLIENALMKNLNRI